MSQRVLASVAVAAFIVASLVLLLAQQSATSPRPAVTATPSAPTSSAGQAATSGTQTSTAGSISPASTTGQPPSHSIEPSPVPGWKTYRSEKYGYEFEYPPDWILEEYGDSVTARDPYEAYDSIYVGAGPDDQGMEAYFAKSCKVIIFAGTDAYYCNQVSGELGGAPSVFVYSGKDKNVLLEIQVSASDSGVSSEILSSFRLL